MSWTPKLMNRIVAVAGVFLVCAACSAVPLEPIEVSEGKSKASGSNEIRITVPGRFKVVICDGSKVKGSPSDTGVTGLFDLKNDPQEKYNYTPTWSGFFSHKIGVAPRREEKTGAIMPGPGTVELVESNGVRAIVKYTWGARAYGGAGAPLNPDVNFEQTFVICAPDRLYQTFTIVGIGEEVKLGHMSFLLHTSHAKWSGGKTGKGGVFSLQAPWTFVRDEKAGPKNCVLHVVKPGPFKHADGTESVHKANFLQVMHKATAGYGYRANLWIGFRTSLGLRAADPVITKGKRLTWHAQLLMNHDITSLEKAAPFIEENRNPGTPKCAKGTPVGDGFDEGKGCYTLKAAADGVDFTLPVRCHWPIFQIADWKGDVPKTITIGGEAKTVGGDFIACIEKGTLLVQIASDLNAETRVQIGR